MNTNNNIFINNNMNNNKANINTNEPIDQNNNNTNINLLKQTDSKEKQITEINDNNQEKESLVKNIINKKEFKSYIPNKYRNQIPNINNLPSNINEKQIISSYEGNITSQNFQNNNFNQNLELDKMERYINY